MSSKTNLNFDSRFENFLNLIKEKRPDDQIKRKMTSDFMKMEDKDGMTSLHWLAWYGRTSLVTEFIKFHAEINKQDYYKNTPLHRAASNGHMKMMEILVEYGARIDIIGRSGFTPQQKAQKSGRKAVGNYLKRIKLEDKLFQCAYDDDVIEFEKSFTNQFHLFIVDRNTNLTLYETLQVNKSNTIINFIRSKSITKSQMNKFRKLYIENDAGFMRELDKNPLCKFIITREVLDFEDHICVEYANKFTALNFKYPLELAVSYGSRLVVADIQKYLVDEDNLNFKKLQLSKIEEINQKTKRQLKNRKKYLKRKFKKNFTRLHVAVMDDCPDMMEYMLNRELCDVDDGLNSVGPAIYHCIKWKNGECLDILSKYQPNMDYIDRDNQSLLHLLIRNKMVENCGDWLDFVTNHEHRDNAGLTALHLAVIEGYEEMINLMINQDTGWNRELKVYVKQSEFRETVDYDIPESVRMKLSETENVISLNLKLHDRIFDCFLPQMQEVDVLKTDNEGNNILHLTAMRLLRDTCQDVINMSSQSLLSRNKKGNTPLMEMIEMAIRMKGKMTKGLIEVVECLVGNGNAAQLNTEFGDGKSVLQKALEAGNELLLLTLTKFKPFIKHFSSDDILYCLENTFFTFLTKNIKRFPRSATEAAITPEIFTHYIDVAPYSCVEVMYTYSDDSQKCLLLENMMYIIYKRQGDMDLFYRLQKVDIEIPQFIKNGETLLTFMIAEGDDEGVEDILQMKHSNKLVNMKNKNGDLPIHLAVRMKQYNLVAYLLPLLSNIDEENDKGETVLYLLVDDLENYEEENKKKSIFKCIQTALTNHGNLYLKNRITEQTPLQQCHDLKWRNELEEIAANENEDIIA